MKSLHIVALMMLMFIATWSCSPPIALQQTTAKISSTEADSDGDGVVDSQDQCDGHDDSIDVDNDGIIDGCDSDIHSATPELDDDNDGVANSKDKCPGFNDKLDKDLDGTPDNCDKIDNRDDDDDGDGVNNTDDKCSGQNDKLDKDGDGIPNACDGEDGGDDDSDGIINQHDKCPGFDDKKDQDNDATPDDCDNIDNRDSDKDGIINEHDVCLGHTDTNDADGDKIPDGCDSDMDNDDIKDKNLSPGEKADNCPMVSNPRQYDFDLDGKGDACDDCTRFDRIDYRVRIWHAPPKACNFVGNTSLILELEPGRGYSKRYSNPCQETTQEAFNVTSGVVKVQHGKSNSFSIRRNDGGPILSVEALPMAGTIGGTTKLSLEGKQSKDVGFFRNEASPFQGIPMPIVFTIPFCAGIDEVDP